MAFLDAVAGEYFGVLGAQAHRGRLLGPQDDRPGAEPAAVISWSWWQTVFGGREDILGHTLVLNFRPFTVVGVAAPDFLGSNADARPQLWMPLAHFRTRYTSWDRVAQDRDVPLVTVVGRLKPAATVVSAEEELSRLGANLDEAYPRNEGRRLTVRPATWIDPFAREAEADTLRIMTFVALGFLLLVCARGVTYRGSRGRFGAPAVPRSLQGSRRPRVGEGGWGGVHGVPGGPRRSEGALPFLKVAEPTRGEDRADRSVRGIT